MESSWFSRSPSSRRDYELPRWRSPSNMAASIIPPPIVESRYVPSPSIPAVSTATKSVIIERPTASESRESELQADLQFLLDAQADGLIKGLEGGTTSDDLSTGSTTPTVRSARGSVPRQVNRPVRRKLGLRSARKGIYNSILALSAIKDDELRSIDHDAQEKEVRLAQIDTWEKKRTGLQEAASSVDASEETIRAQRLRKDADTLQEEINNVESQLADLKTRHRRMLKQASAVENAVQAKIASYTSSLGLLEADVKAYLGSKPKDSIDASISPNGKQSLWQLPPQRRTLSLARDQLNEEQKEVKERRQGVELERQALEDGARVWRDVAGQVTDFEKQLRAEMAGLTASMAESHSAWEDTPSFNSNPGKNLKELLTRMDAVISNLETSFNLAEERNWRLLIAAIGAELDALKRGRQILEDVLEASGAQKDDPVSTDEPGQEIHELDKSFETTQNRSTGRDNRSDMDDEPDPELLFSRQDTDTD